MKTMRNKATPPTKTSSMIASEAIAAFEKWTTPHLLAGKLMRDVTLAYTQAFPGRSIGLIMALYEKLNVSEQLANLAENMEAPHGSN